MEDWVHKLLDPLLEEHEAGVESIMSAARKRPVDGARFRKTLQSQPDLVNACTYPEVDEDILAAVILRFVHDRIFQKILYGSIHSYVEMISFVESMMQTEVEPKRG